MSKLDYLSDLEKKSWNFAKSAHSGIFRKFSGDPYFEHVRKVFKLLKMFDTNEVLGASALLHDVVEDTEFTYDDIKLEFGVEVANLVKELTSVNELVDVMGKPGYLLDKMVSMSDDALTIKLCDRLQNLSDHFSASDKFRIKYYSETKYIIDNLRRWRKLNRKHLNIVSLIEGLLVMMKRRYINTFDDFSTLQENKYEPIDSEYYSVMDYLKSRYEVKDGEVLDKKCKYIVVDEKVIYLSGPLKSKKRAVNKVFNDVVGNLSDYSEPSIRKAIKDFLYL
jgi:hypothetical protein